MAGDSRPRPGGEGSCCFGSGTGEAGQLLRQGRGCPVSGTAGKTLDGHPVLEIEPKAGRQAALGSGPRELPGQGLGADHLPKIDLV